MPFEFGILVALLVAEALYVRAIRVCRRRGLHVGFWQQAAWQAGWGLTAFALLGPPDHLGEISLSAHMAQHLLIADLGVPLLLAGVRAPVLLFYLPRPALVAVARRRGLRRLLRRAAHPLVAVVVYITVLYTWHVGILFEAAIASEWVHAVQHQTFVLASVLVWWSALEPNRRRLAGELWKIGHILGARLAGMMLGMAFIVTRVPVYTDAYGRGERAFGLSAVADQQVAGAMMLGLDFFVTLFALTFFFWRAAGDTDRREQLSVAEEASR